MKRPRIAILVLQVLAAGALQLEAGPWIMADHENMTFVSDASEQTTQNMFRQIQVFKAGMRLAFGEKFPEMKWPLKVIVCKNKRTLESLAPVEVSEYRTLPGYYQRGPGFDLIVLNSLSDAATLQDIVFHELGHRMLEDLGYLPLWLDEGYASVFEKFEVSRKRVKFGLSHEDYCAQLARSRPMPLDRLFAVGHESDEYRRENFAASFYATSWAFVHMCIFARDLGFTEPFFTFTESLKTQPATEELFVRCFGLNYDEMGKAIKKYATTGGYYYRQVDIDEKLDIPRLQFAAADDFTQNLELADVLMHSRRFKEARSKLIRCGYDLPTLSETSTDSVKRRHAMILAKFAVLESADGNFEQGADYADQAYRLGSDDPAALMIHAESLVGYSAGYSSARQLDAEELNTVLKILLQVLEHGLRNKRAHQVHSVAWRQTEVVPLMSHLNALVFACRMFPDDRTIQFNTAAVFRRIGRKTEAVSVLDQFAGATRNDLDREEALKLARILEAEKES